MEPALVLVHDGCIYGMTVTFVADEGGVSALVWDGEPGLPRVPIRVGSLAELADRLAAHVAEGDEG